MQRFTASHYTKLGALPLIKHIRRGVIPPFFPQNRFIQRGQPHEQFFLIAKVIKQVN